MPTHLTRRPGPAAKGRRQRASYPLDFENSQSPCPERAASILLWRNLTETRVGATGAVLEGEPPA
jgi:hypothetical protein